MRVPVADQRVVAGAPATLRFVYVDQDGEPTSPGTVTVGVTRADGTVVLAPGTATVADDDARTVALTPVQTSALDLLSATWTRTADATTYTTRVAVVGGVYFTVAAARASDPALVDDVKFPGDAVVAARTEIENEFERICDVAFVPQYRRHALDGSGGPCLLLPTPLPRRIVAVTELDETGTATAWPAGDVADIRIADAETGEIRSPRSFPCGTANIVIAWEHGHDRPSPDVRQAALLRLRGRLTRPRSAVPDRATSFQVEGGSVYSLDTADEWSTGVPDIDAVLDRESFRIPGIA